ncbi:MAG: carbon-nitrogen hydrolase family protein, partial [Lachnospiraceae bacterium]|nr:carbon-nitrogen hydrolase family protein [Lachnospiraceae bacterium]
MMVKIASAAMHGTRNTEENLKIYQGFIGEAAAQGADLLVLPELSLQGFPASMLACDPGESYELTRTAERVPDGPSTQFMIGQAAKHHMYLVWGMYETAGEPGVVYNAAVLVGPEGYIGHHRKVHLPGVERLSSTPGDAFRTYDTKIGKIGLCVCYDKVFPESTRTLAL